MTVMNKWKVQASMIYDVGQSPYVTQYTGQSFLTTRFGHESILSPSKSFDVQEIDARSDSGCEEIQIVKKVLESTRQQARRGPH